MKKGRNDMLRNLKELEHFKIHATDGEIGHISDFYFDDDAWVVRYIVVDAGSWLSSKKVLISPISVKRLNVQAEVLPLTITKAQVQSSPEIDADLPVARQHEVRYMAHYGYAPYWGGTGAWGDGMYPNLTLAGADADHHNGVVHPQMELTDDQRVDLIGHRSDEPHLRSCHAVAGYHIHATDGDIGHVTGFLIDDDTWAIRYLVIDTSNWWMGHKALIAPTWIEGVQWADRSVSVNLSRELIKDAPPYDSHKGWGRVQDIALHEYYGRGGHWASGAE
jgi:PRC-barrel domain